MAFRSSAPLIRPSGTFSPPAGRRATVPPRPATRGEGGAKRRVRGISSRSHHDLSLERKRDLLLLFCADGDVLFLLSVLLVPRHDRVLARRKIGDRERAVHLRHAPIRMREDGH